MSGGDSPSSVRTPEATAGRGAPSCLPQVASLYGLSSPLATWSWVCWAAAKPGQWVSGRFRPALCPVAPVSVLPSLGSLMKPPGSGEGWRAQPALPPAPGPGQVPRMEDCRPGLERRLLTTGVTAEQGERGRKPQRGCKTVFGRMPAARKPSLKPPALSLDAFLFCFLVLPA